MSAPRCERGITCSIVWHVRFLARALLGTHDVRRSRSREQPINNHITPDNAASMCIYRAIYGVIWSGHIVAIASPLAGQCKIKWGIRILQPKAMGMLWDLNIFYSQSLTTFSIGIDRHGPGTILASVNSVNDQKAGGRYRKGALHDNFSCYFVFADGIHVGHCDVCHR